MIAKPSSKFLKVKCNDCGHEQMVFGKASTEVKCLKCTKIILKPTGSKSNINAKVIKIYD